MVVLRHFGCAFVSSYCSAVLAPRRETTRVRLYRLTPIYTPPRRRTRTDLAAPRRIPTPAVQDGTQHPPWRMGDGTHWTHMRTLRSRVGRPGPCEYLGAPRTRLGLFALCLKGVSKLDLDLRSRTATKARRARPSTMPRPRNKQRKGSSVPY